MYMYKPVTLTTTVWANHSKQLQSFTLMIHFHENTSAL